MAFKRVKTGVSKHVLSWVILGCLSWELISTSGIIQSSPGPQRTPNSWGWRGCCNVCERAGKRDLTIFWKSIKDQQRYCRFKLVAVWAPDTHLQTKQQLKAIHGIFAVQLQTHEMKPVTGNESIPYPEHAQGDSGKENLSCHRKWLPAEPDSWWAVSALTNWGYKTKTVTSTQRICSLKTAMTLFVQFNIKTFFIADLLLLLVVGLFCFVLYFERNVNISRMGVV